MNQREEYGETNVESGLGAVDLLDGVDVEGLVTRDDVVDGEQAVHIAEDDLLGGELGEDTLDGLGSNGKRGDGHGNVDGL